jgi:phage shock protein C
MVRRAIRAHHRGMEPTTTTTANRGAGLSGIRSLRRAAGDRLVAGVAGGLAEYFDVDVVLVRVAIVALALLGGFAVPLYVAAWLLVPEEGTDESIAERILRHGFGDDHGGRDDGTTR